MPDDDLTGNFADLIRQAHRSRGERAVVLIDEYDKPILDHIEHPEVATVMRDGLRDLYATLKDCDEHLRFVFITGVSKFSKVSLFSGLNQLIDLTLEPACSALCGYTDADLDTVFAPELPGLDREEIRRWYNGYNWLGEPVYNPFDVLLLLRNRAFKPYWFETGTPTFLIRLLTERGQFTPELARLTSTADILSTFDVNTIPTATLMFQAGYLTIESMELSPNDGEDADPEQEFITLRYPNREVQGSLNKALLRGLVGDLSLPGPQSVRLARLLRAGDMAGLRELFHAFFASIPHDWYRNSPIAQFEGRALQQIRDRGYADKYLGRGEPVHLVGVEFSRVGRNIVGFEVETVG